MTSLFHVSFTDHPIGTVLQPGRFGAKVRAPIVKQSVVDARTMSELAWESVLEVARRSLAPEAPSRLNCVFGTPSLPEAKQFQQRFRRGALLFEIQTPASAPVHIGDFESITTTVPGATFLDTYINAAMDYWTKVKANSLREVIIGGTATIVAKH